MSNKFYVYEWVRLDKNEPFYVGKGSSNRFKDTSMRNKYFLNVVNKVGFDNIVINIIEDNLDENTAFEREIYYIKLYKEKGYNLTNITNGGEGSSNWYEKLTDEEKDYHKEISKSFLGKKHTEETKFKMSVSATGRKLSNETKNKLSVIAKNREVVYFKGKHHSEETKNILSEKAKGRIGYWKGKKIPEQSRLKMIETQKEQAKTKIYPTAKRVLVINKNNEVIHIFNSIAKCIEYFENAEVTISKACLKKYIKSNLPFNSQYKKHSIYIGLIFILESDYNLQTQSTIESVNVEKNNIE